MTTDRTRLALRVLLPCWAAQSLSTSFSFGSFGPLLGATEAHFHISRTAAAAGMSCMYLAMGLLSPMLGGLLQRVSVRTTMFVGAIVSALGYFGLALMPTYPLALLMYPLIGAGVIILSILGPTTLVSRW